MFQRTTTPVQIAWIVVLREPHPQLVHLDLCTLDWVRPIIARAVVGGWASNQSLARVGCRWSCDPAFPSPRCGPPHEYSAYRRTLLVWLLVAKCYLPRVFVLVAIASLLNGGKAAPAMRMVRRGHTGICTKRQALSSKCCPSRSGIEEEMYGSTPSLERTAEVAWGSMG